MNKVSSPSPFYDVLAFSWIGDIGIGVLSFFIMVSTFAKSGEPKTKHLPIRNQPINIRLGIAGLVIFLLFAWLGFSNAQYLGFTSVPTPTPIQTETITPSPTSKAIEPTQPTRPQAKTSPKPSGDDTQEWGKTIKLDEHTSLSKFASDDRMSTVDELNQAMNQYRRTHNLPTLTFDSLLCNMAQTRADQLQAFGKLDTHAGFGDLAHGQQSFNTLDEVLFGGVNKVSGTHIVEWGWDTSLTGHHEAISDPRWKEGCGGINGLFAVFIFGER
jgi:uncharacterized protein YkwD